MGLVIKMCPICGSGGCTTKRVKMYVSTVAIGKKYLVFVKCVNCGTMGPRKDEIDRAVRAWNNRADCEDCSFKEFYTRKELG